MVVLVPGATGLDSSLLAVYHTTDPLLSNTPIFVFLGPVSSTASSSRIQSHVYSAAGLASNPRLTVSPSHSHYSAVNCLPREEQGDETCRALAFSLLKYFAELGAERKDALADRLFATRKNASSFDLFGDAHAALLASRMQKIEKGAMIIDDLKTALSDQAISWIDVDVVLPPGSMRKPTEPQNSAEFGDWEGHLATQRYGKYAPLVKLFGQPSFIPTSKLRRAPSRPAGLNRHSRFSREQKERIRREMCELVDTEQSYVNKVDELLHSVADEFRQKALAKSASSTSPTAQALAGLFPPCLDQILQANTTFLQQIQAILDETENEAIEDIASTATADAYSHQQPDHTGVLQFANCLFTTFPTFGDCYAEYMHAHAGFNGFLKFFSKDSSSSFGKRVQETGEQKLMSMLIEPVQRLPRYNLYIDNIIKQLPLRHPAVRVFLKTRDIISEICARDNGAARQSQIAQRLSNMVQDWPSVSTPSGRLITAIDVVDLDAPYRYKAGSEGQGMLLLFADRLIWLLKTSSTSMTARALLSELDGPTASHIKAVDGVSAPSGLAFIQQVDLSQVQLAERTSGAQIQLVVPEPVAADPAFAQRSQLEPATHVFWLGGLYEGKASKLAEEIAKARVEARFPEMERDSYRWEARATAVQPHGLGYFCAVFEGGQKDSPKQRSTPADVRVTLGDSSVNAVDSKEEAIVNVRLSELKDGNLKVEVEGASWIGTRDHVVVEHFLATLTKRVAAVLPNAVHFSVALQQNLTILTALAVHTETVTQALEPQPSLHRVSTLRPASPVKLLAGLFSSQSSPTKKTQRVPAAIPGAPQLKPKPPTRENSSTDVAEKAASRSASQKSLGQIEVKPSTDSERLEQTLSAYVLALHARKGNVVGRTLRARAHADELQVNELYNSLLEDPTNHEAAAQAAVDVLFRGFEKFLRFAWAQTMGCVISQETLTDIQDKSDKLQPLDFEEYFETTIDSFARQNKRALRAIVHLLADLLDGTGNDSDRGQLTAAFAEILITGEGDAITYISLLDRLVEDFDSLFGVSGTTTPANMGSMNSQRRQPSHNKNSGSVSSRTSQSSLRRRFGLGHLSRENSKSDHLSPEKGSASVWRTLSKSSNKSSSGQNPSNPPSISRGTLAHSRSTDEVLKALPPIAGTPSRPLPEINDSPAFGRLWFDRPDPSSPTRPSPLSSGLDSFGRAGSPIRPLSQGDPFGSPSRAGSLSSRPNSSGRPFSQGSPLASIGEAPKEPSDREAEARQQPPRKKRRSSLSDLNRLVQEATASALHRTGPNTSPWTPGLRPGTSGSGASIGTIASVGTMNSAGTGGTVVRHTRASSTMHTSPLRSPSVLRETSVRVNTPQPLSVTRNIGLPRPGLATPNGSPVKKENRGSAVPALRHRNENISAQASVQADLKDTSAISTLAASQDFPERTGRLDSNVAPQTPSRQVSVIQSPSGRHGSAAASGIPSPTRAGSVLRRGSCSVRPGTTQAAGHQPLEERPGSGNTRLPRPPTSSSGSSPPRTEGLKLSGNIISKKASPAFAAQTQSPCKQDTNTGSGTENVPPSIPLGRTLSSPAKKLRLQSPQKLRERLQAEQRALHDANEDQGLKQELEAIGRELAITSPSKSGSIKGRPTAESQALMARVKDIETQYATLQSSHARLSNDLQSALEATERKNKQLDSLLREANAENEALYGRFNEELEKITTRVTAPGSDEVKVLLKEARDELAKAKKEITKLRRENVGLRSMIPRE